jgi:hypothetical protein
MVPIGWWFVICLVIVNATAVTLAVVVYTKFQTFFILFTAILNTGTMLFFCAKMLILSQHIHIKRQFYDHTEKPQPESLSQMIIFALHHEEEDDEHLSTVCSHAHPSAPDLPPPYNEHSSIKTTLRTPPTAQDMVNAQSVLSRVHIVVRERALPIPVKIAPLALSLSLYEQRDKMRDREFATKNNHMFENKMIQLKLWRHLWLVVLIVICIIGILLPPYLRGRVTQHTIEDSGILHICFFVVNAGAIVVYVSILRSIESKDPPINNRLLTTFLCWFRCDLYIDIFMNAVCLLSTLLLLQFKQYDIEIDVFTSFSLALLCGVLITVNGVPFISGV